jgi:hydroxymethylbilane synthase
MVAEALEKAHCWPGGSVEIRAVKTSGDRIQDRPLAEVGGKALWTKELDLALLAGETHCSVHSMKDVESERPETLMIAAMLPRADIRDRLIGAGSIAELPPGARVGTSSPRRAARSASSSSFTGGSTSRRHASITATASSRNRTAERTRACPTCGTSGADKGWRFSS